MRSTILGLVVGGSLAVSFTSAPALAAAELIVNGNFETTTMTAASQIGYATTTTTNGVTTTNQNTVTGWTSAANGYNFIFFANSPTSAGQYGNLSLYTSSNGGTGGNASLNSPTGGNVLGADGAFQVGAISQTLSNLTIGTNYLLTFYWAAGQQTGFTGSTTEAWTVSFGSATQSTGTVTTPSQGFTPWKQVSMLFTATAVSQTLSFLAVGTPSGQPPFALLDGVSMVAAPEPATWAIIMTGIGGVAFMARRRRSARLSA